MRMLTVLPLILIAAVCNAQIGAKTKQAEITGIWQNNQFGYQMTLMLNPDGSGEFDGDEIKYKAQSGILSLTVVQQQTTTNYKYALSGSSLTVSGGDLEQPVTFTKAGSEPVSAPPQPPVQDNTDPQAAPTATGAKGIPQELVGKWCWMNVTNTSSGAVSSDRCITLNGDGSYVYYSERSTSVNDPSFASGTNSQNSDRGTWWVQGDRMFYNSQSQGQGSYRLEKRNHPKNVSDPMIVLDGQPFVTAFQKAPWR